ncbi:hypothetical protein QBZ16_004851 [Prototheca wickerhamii]|uniref:3-deoxy-manno-octulosonate cytidylyltransferase n=1 Tax=Prototheca wickerhamii TaxID=3111 RepID=A0AAD9IJI5_PROWI|nr:hypothetical protein QBZ16_004851 [Prototheca wickerhamii]
MSAPKGIIYSLAERTGKVVDIAYTSVVNRLGLTPPFFKEGLGELDVVDFHTDLEALEHWLPVAFDDPETSPLRWRERDRGTVGGRGYRVYETTFPSPLVRDERAARAFPKESRDAHALWVAPDPLPGAGSAPAPTTVQLAATGDHGYARRQHLALPLVAQGIGTVALESPYYGARKPARQRGAKLARVSDLLLLGRGTIEEGSLLLEWLRREGCARLGVGGLSMGGVHATMVAGLFPAPLALTPLLSPRSAASAYCRGALWHATAWPSLAAEASDRGEEVREQLMRAGRASRALRAARFLLDAEATETKVRLAADERGSGRAQRAAREAVDSKSGWLNNVGALAERLLRRVAWLERRSEHAAAEALLAQVMEAFTDVSRFPQPRCPRAAVLVGATGDAYIDPGEVLQLHAFLQGSELRWVPGGHVSSFVLHQEAFRKAIVDAFGRLDPVGVLPARYESSRFPGKPLVPILGVPMILRTYEQAKKAKTLDTVVVATDDERIASLCREHGALVAMTDPDCPNGTERCEQAVAALPGKYDIVINIQGDEPLIEPETIDAVVRALQDSPDAVYSTAATPMAHEEVPLRQRVKVVTDTQGYAVYFSRGVLPHNKDGAVRSYPAPWQDKPYLLHLGIQCYDRAFLKKYCKMPATPLMAMEDLEQLKVLENGFRMKVVEVEHSAHGVDLPEDVASIEKILRELEGAPAEAAAPAEA